jgi:hypothetical protein
MHPFRSRERPADPVWGVAAATPILVADLQTVRSLAFETGVHEPGVTLDGVLVAVRHPTGWFLHAVRRDDMPADQLTAFRELVTVRSYVLLAHGPGAAPAWQPSPSQGEWRSAAFSIARELSELDDALVD